MERSAIRDSHIDVVIPDFASLHPGYAPEVAALDFKRLDKACR
jgi:hypothetical protein